MKVRRIKDAFEKPFRNQSTSAAFSLGTQVSPDQTRNLPSPANKVGADDKGKAKEVPPSSPPPERRTREPSPVWDIELDLI